PVPAPVPAAAAAGVAPGAAVFSPAGTAPGTDVAPGVAAPAPAAAGVPVPGWSIPPGGVVPPGTVPADPFGGAAPKVPGRVVVFPAGPFTDGGGLPNIVSGPRVSPSGSPSPAAPSASVRS